MSRVTRKKKQNKCPAEKERERPLGSINKEDEEKEKNEIYNNNQHSNTFFFLPDKGREPERDKHV